MRGQRLGSSSAGCAGLRFGRWRLDGAIKSRFLVDGALFDPGKARRGAGSVVGRVRWWLWPDRCTPGKGLEREGPVLGAVWSRRRAGTPWRCHERAMGVSKGFKGRAGWSSAVSIRKRAGHGYRIIDVSRLLRSKQRLMGGGKSPIG